MKLKVFQMLSAAEEFAAILKEHEESVIKKEPLLTTRAAIYIRRAMQRIVGHPDYEVYTKTRNELFKKYGTQNGDQMSVTGDNLKPFLDEWKPSAEEEIELKDPFLLDLDLFDGTSFGDRRIAAIEAFIKE